MKKKYHFILHNILHLFLFFNNELVNTWCFLELKKFSANWKRKKISDTAIYILTKTVKNVI